MKIELTLTKEFQAKFIKVSVKVRYWEDSCINGVDDKSGDLTPFRNADLWEPLIDIDKGVVVGWTEGMEAKFHFKVCDAGIYKLLDKDKNTISTIDGYVPEGLCHGDSGYGDYIIFSVNKGGNIIGYKCSIDSEEWENV